MCREFTCAGGMFMLLETDRLILRELTYDDFSDLYNVLADSYIMQHYPYSFDENRVRKWIEKNIQRYCRDGFGLWAVVLKENGCMIGDCGITMQNINGEVLPEVGYHILAGCQKKGYATEAAAECIRYAFEELRFDKVYSYMKYTNEASARVAVKNGMKLMGEYADTENTVTKVYAVTRDEWFQANGKQF